MTETTTFGDDLDISGDVLFGIAQLALDGVEGMTTVAPPVRMGEILGGRRAKGITIERNDGGLRIELNVRVEFGREIPKLANEAQRVVREAVASMTGLQVESVNVTVEAIDLPAKRGAEKEELVRGKA